MRLSTVLQKDCTSSTQLSVAGWRSRSFRSSAASKRSPAEEQLTHFGYRGVEL
jgi:hypothetical protein